MGRISLVLMNVEGSDETVGMAIAKASELIGNMACDGAGGGNPSRGAGDKSPPGAPPSPLHCPIIGCLRSFSKRAWLNNHLRREHNTESV